MDLSDAALIVGLLIVIGVLLRNQWKRRLKGRQDLGVFEADQGSFGTPSAPSDRWETDRSAEKLQLELREFSSQMIAEMETRAGKLEHLIKEAESKILELKKILSELKEGGSLQGDGPGNRRFSEVYDLADRGLNSVEIAKRTGKKPGEVELILGLRNHKKR